MLDEFLLYQDMGLTAAGIAPPSLSITRGAELQDSRSPRPAQQWVSPYSSYPVPAPRQSQPLPPSLFRQSFIMIIDDSTTVRKIVETSLGREGYQVKGFPDGIEAMRWLLQPGSHLPQLLLLDIGLPKIDGYDIARSLRSRSQFRSMIIIILTGRDSILDRLKGRLVGAQAYLTKPFKTQELIGVVTSYLDGAASR